MFPPGWGVLSSDHVPPLNRRANGVKVGSFPVVPTAHAALVVALTPLSWAFSEVKVG
jgi:hypothetical protein